MDGREIWEEIGEGWKNLRTRPLKEVAYFRTLLPQSGRILDIGGGNGRNLSLFPDWKCVVADISKTILDRSRQNVLADMRALPFPDNAFDACLMVNSVHCLKHGRERAFQEMARVLKRGGLALVSAWNRWERRFLPWSIIKADVKVPWRKKGRTIERFYHLFTKRELEKELRKAGLEVLETFKGWDSRESWFAIAKKPGGADQ